MKNIKLNLILSSKRTFLEKNGVFNLFFYKCIGQGIFLFNFFV